MHSTPLVSFLDMLNKPLNQPTSELDVQFGCSPDVLAREQKRLDNLVAGIMCLVDCQFDGPATAYIGKNNSASYVTLCSGGLKNQGEETPTFGLDDALLKYAQQLLSMIADADGGHLAWRHHPELKSERHGEFYVYSRLVFI